MFVICILFLPTLFLSSDLKIYNFSREQHNVSDENILLITIYILIISFLSVLSSQNSQLKAYIKIPPSTRMLLGVSNLGFLRSERRCV